MEPLRFSHSVSRIMMQARLLFFFLRAGEYYQKIGPSHRSAFLHVDGASAAGDGSSAPMILSSYSRADCRRSSTERKNIVRPRIDTCVTRWLLDAPPAWPSAQNVPGLMTLAAATNPKRHNVLLQRRRVIIAARGER